MDCTRLENKRGYFFDGTTLLIGFIGGGESVYCKHLSGRVIYSEPFFSGFRPWNIGYTYDNWDWSQFEHIPSYAFRGLEGYLKFIQTATYEEIKAYFKLKDLIKDKGVVL